MTNQQLIIKLNEIDNLIEYGFYDKAHIEIVKILASLEGSK